MLRPKSIYNHLKNALFYSPYDPEEYWRKRASRDGNRAVMWNNENYNELAAIAERKEIDRYFPDVNGKKVLDLGCGTGRMSNYLAAKGAAVTGVDLKEMIERARKENYHPRIDYLEGSMHEIELPADEFDYILSLGGISACCNTLMKLNGVFSMSYKALKKDGAMLCIDPFHKWPLLARPSRFSAKEIAKVAGDEGFKPEEKRGIFFWPVRHFLTTRFAPRSRKTTEMLFEKGEKCLRFFPNLFSDYKIIILKK